MDATNLGMKSLEELASFPRRTPSKAGLCVALIVGCMLVGCLLYLAWRYMGLEKSKYHPYPYEIPLEVRGMRTVDIDDYLYLEVDLASPDGYRDYRVMLSIRTNSPSDYKRYFNERLVWLEKDNNDLPYFIGRYGRQIIINCWEGEWCPGMLAKTLCLKTRTGCMKWIE
jgi:hypothetical protein